MPNPPMPTPTALLLLLAVVALSIHLFYRRVPFLLYALAWAWLALVPLAAPATRGGWAAVAVAAVAAAGAVIGSARWERAEPASVPTALGATAVLAAVLSGIVHFADPAGGATAARHGALAAGWIVAGWLLYRRARWEAPLGAAVTGLGLLAWGVVVPLEWLSGLWFLDPWWLSGQGVAGTVTCVGLLVLAAELARAGDWRGFSDLELLLEQDPNMICVVREGEVVFANRALRERSGKGPSELEAEGWLDSLSEPERLRALERSARLRRGGVPGHEIDFVDARGREIPVIVTTHPIEWRGAPAWRYEMVDISDRRQAEREVREMMKELQRVNAELEAANRMQAEFLSNTSHELKTPLTSIIANAEILEYEMVGPVNDDQRRVLANISRNSQHLLEMISHLLAYARQREGHETLRLQPVAVRSLLENVAETVRPMLEEGALEVVVEAEDGLECRLDPEKIYRVYLNLVENAIKFSRAGVIRVAARRADGELEGSVSDQGIGIPEDKREEIFQPFRQVDASPTRSYGGVGLGLAICRHLVDLHGGRIWAEAGDGGGATIRFRVPCDGGGR